MGAWIEICCLEEYKKIMGSLPSWERGLKFLKCILAVEIVIVAPLVGAWIEIHHLTYNITVMRSLPSWERGLKSSKNLLR